MSRRAKKVAWAALVLGLVLLAPAVLNLLQVLDVTQYVEQYLPGLYRYGLKEDSESLSTLTPTASQFCFAQKSKEIQSGTNVRGNVTLYYQRMRAPQEGHMYVLPDMLYRVVNLGDSRELERASIRTLAWPAMSYAATDFEYSTGFNFSSNQTTSYYFVVCTTDLDPVNPVKVNIHLVKEYEVWDSYLAVIGACLAVLGGSLAIVVRLKKNGGFE